MGKIREFFSFILLPSGVYFIIKSIVYLVLIGLCFYKQMKGVCGMKWNGKKAAAVCLLSAMLGAGAGSVSAFSLGDVLGSVAKVGGVGVLVSKYGEKINSAINSVMMKEGVGTNYSTKVVPIVSLGKSGYIGAAQVIGDAAQVAQVEAVGQLEVGFNEELVRIKGLVPLNSTNPSGASRVQGVGVSAVMDLKL